MNGTADDKYIHTVSLPVLTTLGASAGGVPLSFVVGVSDDNILRNNLLASPCIAADGSPHQVILVCDGLNVIAKLNLGLEQAENEWVVCMHQDVWLPADWDLMLTQQIQAAELRFGPIGVAGVYGVGEVIPANDTARPLGGTDRLGRRSRAGSQRWAWPAGKGRHARRAAAGRAPRYTFAV